MASSRLDVQDMDIDLLLPWEDNPRVMPDGAMQRLVGSLGEYDIVEPVIFNTRTGRLVGGHQRVEAARILGQATVPTVLIDLDEAREAGLNIALNAKYGDWDTEKLKQTLDKLRSENFDLDLTGLPPFDLDAMMASLPSSLPEPPPIKVGQWFRVDYTDGDVSTLLSFLGQPELPEKTVLGALVLGRIRAAVTRHGED